MKFLVALALIFALQPASSLAQSAAPKPVAHSNPLSAFNKYAYGVQKTILLRSAEKMPEADYNFKPTDAVRTYGQVLAHIADAQYMFCSIVRGEKDTAPKVEGAKTSKSDIVAALKDAFAYCDPAYDNMNDSSATEIVQLNGDTPKLSVLTVNNMHNMEHYGNLVTYMRLKNVVPPTSEPGFMADSKKK